MRLLFWNGVVLAVCMICTTASGCKDHKKLDMVGKDSVRLAREQAELLESMANMTDPQEMVKASAKLRRGTETAEHNQMLQQLSAADRKYLARFDKDVQAASERSRKAMAPKPPETKP